MKRGTTTHPAEMPISAHPVGEISISHRVKLGSLTDLRARLGN